jgi:hypothetical protein
MFFRSPNAAGFTKPCLLLRCGMINEIIHDTLQNVSLYIKYFVSSPWWYAVQETSEFPQHAVFFGGGAFAKLRKATISFVISVRPSVRRLPMEGFWIYFKSENLWKICRENVRFFQNLWNICRENVRFFQNLWKICGENVRFFQNLWEICRENVRFFQNLWKICRENVRFFQNQTTITGTLHEDRYTFFCHFALISS